MTRIVSITHLIPYQLNKYLSTCIPELTFIILDKALMKNGEIEALIGDTNIFLSHDQDTGELVGEIEIMIAEESARGKGLGWESTLIMLKYGVDHLKIKSYLAKIGLDNEKSIQMFGRMGFLEESRSTVFNEITLVRACDSTLIRMLEKELPGGQMDIQDLPLLTE